MKNLKQVLALGMAFSLTMSSMAGAAFTDSADIKAGEAVNMLSALGVIKGYEDGSFKPEGTVTRAEAAKMIFTIRNGGNDDASAWAGTPTSFKDLSGYGWAEGYIKYCQSMGIIAGKSATSFDPGAQVTGVELAKMVLVTMGYNAETAGLVGSTWANKTLGLAGENALLDDVSANLSAGLPRQYAAQLLYNGLNADVVVYENGQYQKVETTKTEWIKNPNGNEWQAVQVTTNKTLGNAYMSLSTQEVVLKSISYDKAKKTFTLKTTGGDFTKVTEDYSELIGQKVNILHKKDKNDEVYGVYANEDSTSVSAVAGKVGLVSGKDAVKIGGTEYKLEDSASKTAVYYINTDTEVAKLDTVLGDAKYDAYQLKLVDNEGNDKFDAAYITPVDVAKVTYVGTKSVSAGGKSYSFDDCNIYEGIAKDDYVVITADKYSVYGETTLVKADKITGKVTGKKDKEVAIDGTWYKTASGYTIPNIGDTCDFVIVNDYVFFSDVTNETNRNVLFVSARGEFKADFGSTTALVETKVMIGNEEKIVKVERLDGKKLADIDKSNKDYTDEDDLKAGMYTYTVNSNGNYELKTLGSGNKAGYDSYVTDYKFIGDKGNLQKSSSEIIAIPDDAVVYVQKAANVTGQAKPTEGLDCITGKDLKKFGKDFGDQLTQVLVSEKDGIKYAKVIALVDADDAAPGASYDTKYGYVVNANGGVYVSQNDAGDTVTYMTIWNGADSLHVYMKGDQTSNIKVGQVVSYGVVSDKEVDNVAGVTTGGAVAITGLERKSEGTIVLQTGDNTSKTYKLDEDVTIVAVDHENKTNGDTITVDAVGLAQSKEDGQITANAYVVYNSNGDKVVAIFWDINNDFGVNYTTK